MSIPAWKRLAKLDWIGTAICLGMVTTLLLPLQWGGVTRAWNDKVIIILFVVFALIVAGFLGWEWYLKEDAILDLSMFSRRTQVGACLEAVSVFHHIQLDFRMLIDLS